METTHNIWGLSRDTIDELGDELVSFHQEFAPLFKTSTRDVSEHAFTEIKGSLFMEGKRTYTEVARKIVDPLNDGQNLQHFMSDSPWKSQRIFDAIQDQIGDRPELRGGMLNLDDSGIDCSSVQKAGAQKQYIGRLGKVEVGQVGVVVSYYYDGIWALVDAELFLPESWFEQEKKKAWPRLHIPDDREFLSKLAIGKAKIDHAIEQGLPFEVVGADTWYGRDSSLRDHIAAKGKWYMMSIPCGTEVYLKEPRIGVPETPAGHRGPRYRNEHILEGVPLTVAQVARQTTFEPVSVRECERGVLTYDHAVVEVWTLREETREDAEGTSYTGLKAVKELLVMRKDTPHKMSYSVSNAPITTDLCTLAQWKSNRYFVERTIQDTKTEAGWDDLCSAKYRAYLHTLAIDALALWFVARVKLTMRPRQVSPEIVRETLGVRRLPEVSFATIRDLLLTVFPLKTLTKEDAVELVTNKLMGRVKSTRSRLKGTQMRM